MENSAPRPDTVNKLRSATDAAFAMLAAMQLDVFTPLRQGPKTVEDIARAIGVSPTRLRSLLYSLVAGGLLTEKHGRFSNTPESDQFLVKGDPAYIGDGTQFLLTGGIVISKSLNRSAPGCHKPNSTFPILHKRNWKNTFGELTYLP